MLWYNIMQALLTLSYSELVYCTQFVCLHWRNPPLGDTDKSGVLHPGSFGQWGVCHDGDGLLLTVGNQLIPGQEWVNLNLIDYIADNKMSVEAIKTVQPEIFTWRKVLPLALMGKICYSAIFLSCVNDYIEPMATFYCMGKKYFTTYFL